MINVIINMINLTYWINKCVTYSYYFLMFYIYIYIVLHFNFVEHLDPLYF